MSEDALLDQAAQLIADARVASLKLGIPPEEIAKIMMDEAILALMAERLSLSDIQATFKRITASIGELDLILADCDVRPPASRSIPIDKLNSSNDD
jgi:hypothetical protein